MKKVLFIVLIVCQNLWANPFYPYIIKTNEEKSFYKQDPPFKDPLQRNNELNSYELNLEKLDQFLKTEKLNQVEQIYKSFEFNRELNLYLYDFEIGTTWEMLPYPLVKKADLINPESWISHFENSKDDITIFQQLSFNDKINQITKTKAFSNNELKLLKTPATYQKILEKIRNSKDHVLMTTFLFQCDAGSEPLLKLLDQKIKNGLRIFLILDSTFSLADRGCLKKLKKIGVNVALQGSFRKIFHEKMYVFDGEYGIIDGQNIVAAQTLSNGYNNLINDTGVGIKGPIVSQIARRFIYHWESLLKKPLPDDLKKFYDLLINRDEKYTTLPFISEALKKNQGVCRLVTNSSGSIKSILPVYKTYIESSKKYLFFNMIDLRFERNLGNFIGNDFLRFITNKANSNPQMRIDMLTNHWKLPTDISLPDGVAAKPTIFSHLITKPGKLIIDPPHKQITKGKLFLEKKILNNNFHWWASAIYEHSKTIMIDNKITIIGSYNINNTSENQSFEQALVCHDDNLAQQMQKTILVNQLNSIPIFLE
jgi:phosphatidylserine/phosphatidylglycerophosphate/cardiolipin synthase-like enzyme